MDQLNVSTVEALDALIMKVKKAQLTYSTFTQEKVDKIFRHAALAASDARISLAKLAVSETGMGIIEDKVIKNHFASEYIYNEYRDEKTCGIIERDQTYGITKIAEPIGVIAGIIPTTNPTSTAIFKSLLALKTRNAIIYSPHPRAKKSTIEAARTILDAAVNAGAPEHIIGWIDEPNLELTNYLLTHPGISLILATGGPGIVRAAYSSGKPAIGVGAGNTPAVIDEDAHIKMAASSILMSKTFDNGVICASEQSIIVDQTIYEQMKAELIERGAYFLTDSQKDKVRNVLVINGKLNSKIAGQSAITIASMAGINVPDETRMLVGEVTGISLEEPFAYEKLSPTLAMYKAVNFQDAVDKAVKLVELGGIGHTAAYYTDARKNRDRIHYFGERLKTGRVIVNMPASQGAIGDIYNFKLSASLTLGCGSWGGNSVSENVGVKHLMNIKTVAERRENMLWFRVPPKIYFKYGALPVALRELENKKRAFIVTDKPLYDLGYADKVVKILDEIGIETLVFSQVDPDPTITNAKNGVSQMQAFNPDVIIALGGGSPMDAAKIMWILYEHPEVKFRDLAIRFMDIRKRIYQFPKLGNKAMLIAVPTTSGTGSEVTPFAVITDDKTGIKYPIADYELTPNVAIVDPELVLSMPKPLTAFGGFDALVHAIEAYTSVFASEYTNGLALEAIRLVFKYLPSAYANGSSDLKAREKMHYAATIAGMAFANAFLGVNHSMAHKLGAAFHLPHGLANALLISQVIRFNAAEAPRKQTAFPQYKYPQASARFARIADYLELGGETNEDKIKLLIDKIQDLKRNLNIPLSIKDAGVPEAAFMAKIDDLSELAFDDQCTGANPRYPLISEIRDLYSKAFHGETK